MRWLLGHGLEVDARDSDRATPLHLATAHLARPIMQALLAAGAGVNAADAEVRLAAALCSVRPGSRLACSSRMHLMLLNTRKYVSCPCKL